MGAEPQTFGMKGFEVPFDHTIPVWVGPFHGDPRGVGIHDSTGFIVGEVAPERFRYHSRERLLHAMNEQHAALVRLHAEKVAAEERATVAEAALAAAKLEAGAPE